MLNKHKMMIILYFLMMVGVSECNSHHLATVDEGATVELTCIRESSGSLFWIRNRSGGFLEYLGKTFSSTAMNAYITTTQRPGLFVLTVERAKLTDTGVYYCLKFVQSQLIFLNTTLLTVKAKNPTVTTVHPPDPVHPEASDKKSCPAEHNLCCFMAGSRSCHPKTDFTQERSANRNNMSSAGPSTKTCICDFLQNISVTFHGTYFCAVDTCEGLNSTNTSSPENEDKGRKQTTVQKLNQDSQMVINLLCAALAVCFIIIVFLIYVIRALKKQSCGRCNADPLQERNAETVDDQQTLQTDEDLIYSTAFFTRLKSGKAGMNDGQTGEESIYAHVRVS